MASFGFSAKLANGQLLAPVVLHVMQQHLYWPFVSQSENKINNNAFVVALSLVASSTETLANSVQGASHGVWLVH